MTNAGYAVELQDSDSRYAVIVEDDGKVAYSYLLDGGDIVSDVWLYNVAPPPESPEWDDPDNAPFANPREYCVVEAPPEVRDPESDITIEWLRADGATTGAVVMIKGTTMARVEPGSKPGWSRLASKDGPLARVLAT